MSGHQSLKNCAFCIAGYGKQQLSAGQLQLSDVWYFTGMAFCFQIETEGLGVEQTRPHHSNTCTACLGLKVLSVPALDEDTVLGISDITTFLGNQVY